jgi:sugar phosphate isomerase/epimerase
MNRRAFLLSSLAAAAALARATKAMQLSLAAYSYNRHLNLRSKTKPTMTLEQFIDEAARMKLPAVELTQYYFRETTDEYLKAIRARVEKHGMTVSGTAVGNDFCLPDDAKRAEQLEMVKKWTEHTALLGGRTMRIFAGSVKKGDSEAVAVKRALEMIGKAVEHAAKHKVKLGLENHGGITSTPEQLLALVNPIKSEWYGVNVDTGNFHTADPYADIAKIMTRAVNVQVKTEVIAGGKREEADLERLIGILRKAEYSGFVVLEYEAKEEPRDAVPRYIEKLKKLLA